MKQAIIGKNYKYKGSKIKILNKKIATIKKGKVEVFVPVNYVTNKKYKNKCIKIINSI